MKSNIYSIRRALCVRSSVSNDAAFSCCPLHPRSGISAGAKFWWNPRCHFFQVRYVTNVLSRPYFLKYICHVVYFIGYTGIGWDGKRKTEKMHVTEIMWTYFPCDRYSLRRQHVSNRNASVHGNLRKYLLPFISSEKLYRFKTSLKWIYSKIRFLIRSGCMVEVRKREPTELHRIQTICNYFSIHSSIIQYVYSSLNQMALLWFRSDWRWWWIWNSGLSISKRAKMKALPSASCRLPRMHS